LEQDGKEGSGLEGDSAEGTSEPLFRRMFKDL